MCWRVLNEFQIDFILEEMDIVFTYFNDFNCCFIVILYCTVHAGGRDHPFAYIQGKVEYQCTLQ